MAAATPAPAGAFVLQIGAYKSQAEAENAWKPYKAKHAALLSGYSDTIQQADLGEKGTWYRLRIGGFVGPGSGHGPLRPPEGGRRRLHAG